ncbi:MAG: radical SAM protein [Thermofilum sp. ex4484_82]|nr:MAG: radical SAM protein [Thermofilum sp. ex4484_82]OYT39940.1 MAG: radical SAM protein [Archaeoglobales archaeon ex4484_92]
MSRVRVLPTGSIVLGKLPPGCSLCQRGRKSIIFITGLCLRKCFYCPLSLNRRKDVFFVNEKQLKKYDRKQMLAEILLSDSHGAGITGGDPLVKIDVTLSIINYLKEVFSNFHIHLYTSGVTLTKGIVSKLDRAGLDELRIHPSRRYWNKIKLALENSSMRVGAEIPVLPGAEEEIIKFAKYLDSIEADFLNLNELEFSETNAIALLQRGYKMREDYITAKGSRETAINVIEWATENLSLSIHFCPAVVKDRYQTSLRLYRRAVSIAKNYQEITDEGLLRYVEVKTDNLVSIKNIIPPPLRETHANKACTSMYYADKLVKKSFSVYIIEEAPTFPRQIINKEEYRLCR